MFPQANRAALYPVALGGIAFIVGAALLAWALYASRSAGDALSVTGSAKQTVAADSVKWTSNISRIVYESGVQAGHAQIARDGSAVKDFLSKSGIPDADITMSPIFVEQYYEYNQGGAGAPIRYQLRQTITVNSDDPSKVDALAKNVGEIINKGILLQTQAPEYYYSKLPELRVSLLADALRDAKARAQSLASATGQSVGALQSAASGVVQVLAPNSIDISDYGNYDTGSMTKEVMVTVRASFVLR